MNTEARKETVDQRVALELGLPVDTVRLITACFLCECIGCLTEYGLLVFKNFGRLKVGARGPHNIVRFTQGLDLREALHNRRKEMPDGEIWRRRVDDPGAREASNGGVPGVREET
jgi:hypothetical protein